ncbi:protein MNN4-like [Prosopis cineraria]|uniref:protein MNN4-like n=1 Tax=Prosopis cineraria TaxID=364024 RepID=UPI00241006BC|nr:protein MNN4-like [Prosopis cineraria]
MERRRNRNVSVREKREERRKRESHKREREARPRKSPREEEKERGGTLRQTQDTGGRREKNWRRRDEKHDRKTKREESGGNEGESMKKRETAMQHVKTEHERLYWHGFTRLWNLRELFTASASNSTMGKKQQDISRASEPITEEDPVYRATKAEKKKKRRRATESGYCKEIGVTESVVSATGKKVWIKKYLVFNNGESPHGTEISWVIQKYHLCSSGSHNMSRTNT